MKNLIIVGAGGQGREVLNWALNSIGYNKEYIIKGFIDDDLHALDDYNYNYKIIDKIKGYEPDKDEVFTVSIGLPKVKKEIVSYLKKRRANFLNIIHNTAIIADNVDIGIGNIICPNVVISADAKLCDHIAINIGSTIGHDSVLSNYITISSNCDITGNVKIDKSVFIGSNVTIIPQISIGKNAFLCAGSTIMSNVPPNSKMLGLPAKNFNIK